MTYQRQFKSRPEGEKWTNWGMPLPCRILAKKLHLEDTEWFYIQHRTHRSQRVLASGGGVIWVNGETV